MEPRARAAQAVSPGLPVGLKLLFGALELWLAAQKLSAATDVLQTAVGCCLILLSCHVFNSVLNDAAFFPDSNNVFLHIGRNKHDG